MRACPPEAVGKLELKFLRAAGDAGAVDAVMPAKPSKSEDKLFAEMKTRAPDVAKSTNYQYALAYGEILYGDAHAPMGWLAKVPKGDDNYVRAEYLLGRANLAIAAGQDGADRKASLNAAAQALSVAYTANPDDAATNYFLAESLDDNTGLPSDNAVNAAVNAVDAAPSVYAYAELAALLELRRNDRGRCSDAVDAVLRRPARAKARTARQGRLDGNQKRRDRRCCKNRPGSAAGRARRKLTQATKTPEARLPGFSYSQ
ncbi:MAG: hypothetical protein WDN06_20315 [Asticcacaulis sp.]